MTPHVRILKKLLLLEPILKESEAKHSDYINDATRRKTNMWQICQTIALEYINRKQKLSEFK